ncbi:hypothetical protein ASE86_12205 [Sphingomonas sp. Leaf33]|nr:hypothetical protein ASE86_12205 [Sphingomonas sp. Leaf33]
MRAYDRRLAVLRNLQQFRSLGLDADGLSAFIGERCPIVPLSIDPPDMGLRDDGQFESKALLDQSANSLSDFVWICGQ